jgi:hypothetical protein
MKRLRIALVVVAQFFFFAIAENITVYKSPTCGCCSEWVEIMEKAGHKVRVHHTDDLQAVKDHYGLPRQLGSCHTAIINGYVFEGHIPEQDIMDFLRDTPEGAKGLAVPGMPAHSPGMARKGDAYRDFNVIMFDEQERLSLFKRY